MGKWLVTQKPPYHKMYIHRTKWAFGWGVPRNTYLELNLKMIPIGIFLTQFSTEFQNERKTENQNVPPTSWKDTLILLWTQRAITLWAPLLVVTPRCGLCITDIIVKKRSCLRTTQLLSYSSCSTRKMPILSYVFPLTVGKAVSVFHGYRKDPSCLSLNWNLAFSQ